MSPVEPLRLSIVVLPEQTDDGLAVAVPAIPAEQRTQLVAMHTCPDGQLKRVPQPPSLLGSPPASLLGPPQMPWRQATPTRQSALVVQGYLFASTLIGSQLQPVPIRTSARLDQSHR